MALLVGSSALLAMLLTLVLHTDEMHRAALRRSQLSQLAGELLYLDEELQHSFWQRFLQPVLVKMRAAFARIAGGAKRAGRKNSKDLHLQNELSAAGIRMQAHEYRLVQFLVTAGILVVGCAIALLFIQNEMLQVLALLFAVMLAILTPRYYLAMRIKSRRQSMQNQLPNVLDVLSVSIEAGLGFDAALLKVIERFNGALIDELAQVYREVQMGMPRRESLNMLAQRNSLPELKTLVSAIVQSEQYGTPLKNVLRVQAQQLRVQRRQQAQEKGMKAPVRMMLPMVLLIFPVLFIVLLGPTIINLVQQFG